MRRNPELGHWRNTLVLLYLTGPADRLESASLIVHHVDRRRTEAAVDRERVFVPDESIKHRCMLRRFARSTSGS
jgi:hypothetical protein